MITRGFGVRNQRRWTNEKHCDEKLRYETLAWQSNIINHWKQNTTRFLPIDGDGKGRCGLLWLFFSLFVFLQVMSNASFIVQWRSLCSRFFHSRMFGDVVGFALLFCWTSIKEDKQAKKVIDEKFSDVKHLSTLNMSAVKCHFGWLWVRIFVCVVFVLRWLLRLMGKNALWLKTFIN